MPIIPEYNTDRNIQKLMDMIGQLRQDVDSLLAASKVNQLNYSSLNDTALPIYGTTSAGVAELKTRLGMQPDGTYAITYHNGSAPPNPINIGVANRQLGILVTWDGSFAGNAPKPLDFDRLDVYIDVVSGFTPRVSNLYGSLFTDSALFIGADVTPHFVKVATVNKSGVASFPSFEIPVTPLPAAQLAAGSVTAVTLDAELVLATDIIIGNRFDSHIVLTPVTGIQLYASDGTTVVVDLDILSGNATFTGDVSTQTGTDRILLTHDIAGNPVINLFRSVSTTPAQITSAGQSLSSSADLILRSSVNNSYTPNREGRLEVTEDGGVWHWADIGNSGTARGAEFSLFRTEIDMRIRDTASSNSSGALTISNNEAYIATIDNVSGGFYSAKIDLTHGTILAETRPPGVAFNTSHLLLQYVGDTEIKTAGDILLYKDNGSGSAISSSVLRMRQSGTEPEIISVFYDVGIRWTNNNKIFIINNSGGARAIAASSFDVASSAKLKRDIVQPSIKPRDLILNINTKSWNYSHEPEETASHLFPVAEELSTILPNVVDKDGTVDLRDIVGFLLQLCKEQEIELQAIRTELNNKYED